MIIGGTFSTRPQELMHLGKKRPKQYFKMCIRLHWSNVETRDSGSKIALLTFARRKTAGGGQTFGAGQPMTGAVANAAGFRRYQMINHEIGAVFYGQVELHAATFFRRFHHAANGGNDAIANTWMSS